MKTLQQPPKETFGRVGASPRLNEDVHGIKQVEVSLDDGKTWKPAVLGKDLGRFAFRGFSSQTGKIAPGSYVISSRATNTRARRRWTS